VLWLTGLCLPLCVRRRRAGAAFPRQEAEQPSPPALPQQPRGLMGWVGWLDAWLGHGRARRYLWRAWRGGGLRVGWEGGFAGPESLRWVHVT
jgi:hypothetical protein